MTKDVIMTDEAQEAAQSVDLAAGRRAFIQNLGMGAVGAAVFGAAAGLATPAAAAPTVADVLNFALNLEYLEATFYSFASSGADLDATTVGAGSGAVSGGSLVPFQSSIVKAYANEIAVEEKKHVQAIKYFLQGNAVTRPLLDIGPAFATAAKAAGINNGGRFNAYKDDTSFLLASYIFEDVGVTAYTGAARYLINTPYLTYAAGIQAVEAYHAGIIRTSLFAATSTTVVQDTALISRLRSKLSTGKVAGPKSDDIGIGVPARPTLAPLDDNALVFVRTPRQVQNIVYGKMDATSGLFFPNGMSMTTAPTTTNAR